MARNNLVIVRAGDASLHPQWLVAKDRTWDLVLIYAGSFPGRYVDQYDHLHLHAGSKWTATADFLVTHPGFVEQYEYVWLPDEDLLTTGRNIDNFFELCKTLRLNVAQPAYTPYSHYIWEITLQRPTLTARITNFIEISAPCFKVETFDVFGPTFGENTSGHGYEFLWSHLADRNGHLRRGIVDRTPVYRTRPIGYVPGAVGDPAEEQRELFLKYEVWGFEPTLFQEIPWAGFP